MSANAHDLYLVATNFWELVDRRVVDNRHATPDEIAEILWGAIGNHFDVTKIELTLSQLWELVRLVRST